MLKKYAAILAILALGLLIYFNSRDEPATRSPYEPQRVIVHEEPESDKPAAVNEVPPADDTRTGDVPPDSAPQKPRPELHGQAGKAPEIYSTADEALKYILEDREKSSHAIAEFSGIQETCSWCGELFKKLADLVVDPSRPADERAYAGLFLSATGNIDAAKALLKAAAAADVKPGDDLSEAIARMAKHPEVALLYIGLLEQGDTKIRFPIIAGLTYVNTVESAKALYEDLVRNDDTVGFASNRVGLSYFSGNEDAVAYLIPLVERADKFSALPFRALLNSGQAGTAAAIEILKGHPEEDFFSKLAEESPQYVQRYVESSEYIGEIEAAGALEGNALKLAEGIRKKMKNN